MRTPSVVTMITTALLLSAALRAEDSVLLMDGTILKGQVLEETKDHVVVVDHGLTRTFDRGMVVKVEFNSGAAAAPVPAKAYVAPKAPVAPLADGGTVPSLPPDMDQQGYSASVADYYKVPASEVVLVQEHGIPVEEVPVVFNLAAHARVAPGVVVGLRLGGMSWSGISLHFNLGPDIFYWKQAVGDADGPYTTVYSRYRAVPRSRWSWNTVALEDRDIVNCVNLRFVSERWHRQPVEVMRLRGAGHPFVSIWSGYRPHEAVVVHESPRRVEFKEEPRKEWSHEDRRRSFSADRGQDDRGRGGDDWGSGQGGDKAKGRDRDKGWGR